MTATPSRLLLCVLSLAAAWSLLGCTSSGDGGNIGPVLARGGEYTSSIADVPAGSVFLEQSTDQPTSFCLDVRVEAVVDLWAVAFTLAYDDTVIDFSSSQSGGFLGSTTQATTLIETNPGEVVVGIARRADQVSTGVTSGDPGTENPVVTLCFDILDASTDSPIQFVPNSAGLDSNKVQIIGLADFYGGTISTNL
ncbi:MAG: hypothetical protein AAF533_07735 [Acidobacteriota bacterium]